MSLGGDFEKGKRDPNKPKVIFLLIKTYFSEYLRPERSPQLGVVLVIYSFITFESQIDLRPQYCKPMTAVQQMVTTSF